MSDLLSDLLGSPESPLQEASDTDSGDSVAEPTDGGGEESNNDLEQDKTDVKKDTDDTSSDDPDPTDDSEGTTDDAGEDDQSDAQDGNDSSTSAPFENDPEAEERDGERKLALYKQLKDVRVSFKSTATILEKLLTSDLPDSNLETVRILRNRVSANVESLDDLLSNAKIASSKTYEDLLVLHNIYLSDLSVLDTNLKAFIRLLNSRQK